MATSEQVNLDLTATDKASKVVDSVGDKVEELEKHPAEVEVTADTGKAVRSLDDLTGEAKRLAQQDWILNFKADIAQAKDDAAKLEGQLKQTGEAGETAGDKVSSIGGANKVNAVRDLTGPLGDVSSQVGDLGESFSAAGELIEEKMGLAAGSLTNFLGPLGLAAGAVFAFWTMYKKRAEEARKATLETAASITELGATAAAAKKVEDMLKTDPDLVTHVQELGLSYQDLIDLVSGKAVPAFDQWRDLLGLLDTAQLSQRGALGTYLPFVDAQAKKLGLTRDELLKLLPAMKDVTDAAGGQADQFAASRDIADKLADVMGRRLTPEMADVGVKADTSKQSLHDVQLELHGIDGSHARADVTVTDNGTAADTTAKINAIPTHHLTEVQVEATLSAISRATLAAAGIVVPRGASVTNVTIHAPAGMRAADLVAAGDRYARRNGGRSNRARR